MNKRLIWICAVALILLLPICSSSESIDRSVPDEAGHNIKEVHVNIPGPEKDYHFHWGSNLHIVIDNDEIADDQHDFVVLRQTSWA